jgi:hypothetical protein
MGVGDRHSKRPAAADKHKDSSPLQRSHVVDDRELDDAFSAWDEHDAGAHKQAHAATGGGAVSTTAPTRVERRPAAAASAPATQAARPPVAAQGSSPQIVDPVARHDIVISRARTLHDPLTTGLLAEIARMEAANDRGSRPSHTQRARTYGNAVKISLPKSEDRTAGRPPDMLPTEPPEPTSRESRDAIAAARRTTRRVVARDEPFRKK